MMDLEEGRSLINNLQALGLDIYIITWGYPGRMDRFITLDDYIDIYLDDCVDFRQPRLIKGELEISGRRVDMKRIDMPVFNVFAEQDHLVPPACSRALKGIIASTDYTEKSFPVGHIGMYVSSRSQRELAPAIAGWLRERSAV